MTSNEVGKPQRQTEITDAKLYLEREVAGLDAVVERVGIKFSDVMRNSPQVEKKVEEKMTYATPLADYIADTAIKVGKITQNLQTYCDRCEL
jgi:hypothetical protein